MSEQSESKEQERLRYLEAKAFAAMAKKPDTHDLAVALALGLALGRKEPAMEERVTAEMWPKLVSLLQDGHVSPRGLLDVLRMLVWLAESRAEAQNDFVRIQESLALLGGMTVDLAATIEVNLDPRNKELWIGSESFRYWVAVLGREGLSTSRAERRAARTVCVHGLLQLSKALAPELDKTDLWRLCIRWAGRDLPLESDIVDTMAEVEAADPDRLYTSLELFKERAVAEAGRPDFRTAKVATFLETLDARTPEDKQALRELETLALDLRAQEASRNRKLQEQKAPAD